MSEPEILYLTWPLMAVGLILLVAGIAGVIGTLFSFGELKP